MGRRNRFRSVAGTVAGALLAVACLLGLAAPAPQDASAQSNPGAEDRQLESTISNYLSDSDGQFGVTVLNLSDGRYAFVNADARFPTASMYKLLVMYRVMQAMDRQDIFPTDTLYIQDADAFQDEPDQGFFAGETPTMRQALDAMITVSSNSAAYALTRQIGGWLQIQLAAQELGMQNTYTVDDYLWSTPRDMAHLFQLMAEQRLVNPDVSRQMIALLQQQTENDRIPALLPAEADVAHKTGEMDDVRNDGGIVDSPRGRYVIVLMSRGGTPDDEAQLEAEISRLVYRRYGE
jgi:beta-lactamase class A